MARDYIFVSYSHADEDWLKRLQVFLKPFPWGQSYRDGGKLWADPYIKTGEVWRREIDDALARTRIAVLLVTQDFLASDFVNRSELPPLLEAAQAGEVTIVCVPIGSCLVDLSHRALLDYQWPRPASQPLNLLPSSAERDEALALVFRKLFDVAKDAGLAEAGTAALTAEGRATIEAPLTSPLPTTSEARGRLYGVPDQRPHHVPRLDLRERIRAALLASPRGLVGLTGTGGADAAGSRVGVYGQGGLGKTVAAIDLVANDETVQRAFPDGIYWLTFGQKPDLLALQSGLIEQLTGAPRIVESVTSGTAAIRDLFSTRTCLLVLDDVWSFQDASAFDVAGSRSRLLLTTRDASLLTALGAQEIKLDVLTEPLALDLLAGWTGVPRGSLPEEASALVRRCGYLPLAVAVAGALARDGRSWSDLLEALEAGNIRFLEHPYASVFTSLRLSVDNLAEGDRARLLELAVAPEDEIVPVSVVARLWGHTGGLEPYECHGLLTDLQAKGLLYLEGEAEREGVRLHDLQRDFLQLAADDVPKLHSVLLDAFATLLSPPPSETHRAWWTLPADELYLWHHLGDHLARSGRHDELRGLLLDYDWISAKLRVTDINALLNDYDWLAGDRSLERVQGALRLSAHVVAKDPDQLAGQLTGRLVQAEGDAEIQTLLSRAATSTSIPWLRPLRKSLVPPGGALLRTLKGHVYGVSGVAVTPADQRAVSASSDHTLKVWDLQTGAVLHTLEGHTDRVRGVAVTPDGQRVVSASDDGTVKVWDLRTDEVLHTLEGHAYGVRSVAVTPDGKRAVSASEDHTLKVWNLQTGAVLHTLEGHTDRVCGVAVTPDGQRAVSASSDHTLKVWDLQTGAVLHTLEGHANAVRSVAVTPDGKRAVSASKDKTLKVWDLRTGAALRTLEGHTDRVGGVAATPDGQRAVSASDDHTLKVWDLQTGAVLHTFEGHGYWVRGVAVTPDGQLAVSASDDHTLKVWDLATRAVFRAFEGHAHLVYFVAVTSEGKRVVSASEDKTLKVWDLATGVVQPMLIGSTVVAVTPDGNRAVSAHFDSTLSVWDLSTRAVLHTLEGHANWVRGVAVTPDGQRAVSASSDHTLKVWDLQTGAVLHTLEGHANWVRGVAVTPDGQRAISASSDHTLKVWDLQTGAVLHTLEGHAKGVLGVAVTPDGQRAVSASSDHTLKVWDLQTGVKVAVFTADGPAFACAVAPGGRTIVLGDSLGRVHFLRIENV